MTRSVQLKLAGTALLVLLGSCASSKPARPRVDPNVIRRDQMLDGGYPTAYEAVRAIHPNWLIKRRVNDANRAVVIWVYVDNSKYGDITWLRNIAGGSVESIRRIDAATATTRWGVGHSEGVIYVTSYVPR